MLIGIGWKWQEFILGEIQIASNYKRQTSIGQSIIGLLLNMNKDKFFCFNILQTAKIQQRRAKSERETVYGA